MTLKVNRDYSVLLWRIVAGVFSDRLGIKCHVNVILVKVGSFAY